MSPLQGLDEATFVLFAAILFFAGLVHGTLGLGFPLTATPLLALFTDMRSAIVITLFPTVAVNILSIVSGGNWLRNVRAHWPLAAYAGMGSIVGTQLLILLDPAPFKLLLAAVVLVYLNLDRLHPAALSWTALHRGLAMLVFGALAGVLAGTVNVMVPILVIYALESGLTPAHMVQVFNLCFLAGKVSQIGVFSVAGILDPGSSLGALPLIASAAAALGIGMRIRRRIAAQVYRAILRKVLLGIAVLLIAQFLFQAAWARLG